MPEYITPPITTEPDDLASEAFAYLEDRIPGWLPAPGNLETWLIESLAQLAGELSEVASSVPAEIFRYFGASLLDLPARAAVPAMATTTWTVRDAAGYTIPAGTLIGIAAAGDDLVAFEVAGDATIAPGATTATGVVAVATEAGEHANGLTATPELIDALDFVTGVALVGATSGGVDAEEDADYLNRLRELLTLLAPRPILPEDFAILAKTVAGVHRATAIDNYDASTGTANVERAVTVVVVGEDGEPVSAATRDEVDALLQSEREVNFLVYVRDPTYTTVNVVFAIKPYPDFNAAEVVARAQAAVADWLSPANFGTVPYGDQPRWLADTKIRYLEAAEVVNRVEGVWWVDSLTLNGAATDVALTGIGPLPRPGTVTGSAIA